MEIDQRTLTVQGYGHTHYGCGPAIIYGTTSMVFRCTVLARVVPECYSSRGSCLLVVAVHSGICLPVVGGVCGSIDMVMWLASCDINLTPQLLHTTIHR